MRRSATVTSSLPPAAIASASSASEEKPPVPITSRERSVLPAIARGSVAGGAASTPAARAPLCVAASSRTGERPLIASAMSPSSSLHRRQHLHAGVLGQHEGAPLCARHDLPVDRHRDAALLGRDAE